MDIKELFHKMQANNHPAKQHQINSCLLNDKAKEDYVANWNS
jgi:hypothetical protein